jgi:hypothetical protein
MFLDEATAKSRIESSKNLLSRISRDDSSPESYPVILPVAPDSSDDDEATDQGQGQLASLAGELGVGGSLSLNEPPPSDISDQAVVSLLKETGLVQRPRNLTTAEQADCAMMGTVISPALAAETFQKSRRHVSALQNGVTDHNGYPVKEALFQEIENQKSQLRRQVTGRLEYALGLLSNEKMREVQKAKDISGIALQLAQILDKTLPREMQKDDTLHFHVYRPEIKTEKEYKVIEVTST